MVPTTWMPRVVADRYFIVTIGTFQIPAKANAIRTRRIETMRGIGTDFMEAAIYLAIEEGLSDTAEPFFVPVTGCYLTYDKRRHADTGFRDTPP